MTEQEILKGVGALLVIVIVAFIAGYEVSRHYIFQISKRVVSGEQHANIFGYPYKPEKREE